jgi:hypothetical protein
MALALAPVGVLVYQRPMQFTLRFLFVFICVLGGFNQAEAKKPNIILVITDDQGYGPVGQY